MENDDQTKANYETHVALIAMTKKVGLGEARFLAYLEGAEGLAKRVTSLQQGVAQKTLAVQPTK